jgi:hypothetical protein
MRNRGRNSFPSLLLGRPRVLREVLESSLIFPRRFDVQLAFTADKQENSPLVEIFDLVYAIIPQHAPTQLIENRNFLSKELLDQNATTCGGNSRTRPDIGGSHRCANFHKPLPFQPTGSQLR